ncbi:MAG: B12-binding domain-containing radical SAM protein [Elusimicrobia bacterium]|nr:B12-binding domain-containing radical SAM protein [Elusimicrobiota bacterium]
MRDILFIVPPNISYAEFTGPSANVKAAAVKDRVYGAVITDLPLGALSLSAYAKKLPGIRTALLDFNVLLNKADSFAHPSFREYFSDVLSRPEWTVFAPRLVAISALFTPSYRSMLEIAGCCRGIFPDALIVAGGGVPTNMYREIFAESAAFDALCYGEGEKPLLALAAAADPEKYLREDPSWITREKAGRGSVFRHSFLADLDEIPFYDYDLCDLPAYEANPTILSYTSVGRSGRALPVMTSRGCTFRCCFCSSHTVHGREMRYHGLGRVRTDLQRLKEGYGAGTIIFQDDHFLADKRRALAIISMLRELGLTAFFPNSLALYALDREVLEALRGVGVRQLVLSIESGSGRVLSEIMHKPLKLEIARRVADECRELGIYTDVNILIGLPGETERDINDARAFLKTINANWFRINVATPLAGSEMLEVCLEKNYLKGGYIDSGYKKAVVETGDFTSEYIQEMSYVMNLELNFAGNADVRLGAHATALQGFENAIRAKSTHALAYYYAAECCGKLGDREKQARYAALAARHAADPFWRKYIDMFKLPL